MQFKRLTSAISLILTLIFAFSFLSPVPATAAKSLEPDGKLSPELKEIASASSPTTNETVRVIVQTRADARRLNAALNATGGRVRRSLPLIDSYVAEVPSSALSTIASDDDTLYVSLDRKTSLLADRYDYNLLRATTGAENVIGSTGLNTNLQTGKVLQDYLRSLPEGPNGTGVTIAVLDSGVYDDGSLHEDLRAINDPAAHRILTHKNFVSTERPGPDQLNRGYDPFGHGTHVAGVAAGSGRESLEAREQVGNFYAGIAFNARLIDLRVIASDGQGYISDTIAAIEWMIDNRAQYNIRIANFSIGAAITQSYKTDPLCQAVGRAVRAGIVCVVAAGNYGKDASGKTVYGGILAPANEPSAITVGATNTLGSALRSDDTIASYSSRGPTPIDFGTKPDIVAPGTLIRSIAADKNHLTVHNNLTVYSRDDSDVYMWLSGTSVAAPVVAGAVALMLDANPGLTPAMVKSILQFTAQPLASLENVNPLIRLLTEGAGQINVDAAVRLSRAIKRDSNTRSDGSSLLTDDTGLLTALLYSSQDGRTGNLTSAIAGELVDWGNNVFYSNGLVYFYDGNRRLSVYKIRGWQIVPSFNLFDGYLLTGSRLLTDARVLTEGRILSDARLITDARVMTDSRMMTDGWFWDAGDNSLTNAFAARYIWFAALIDQSALAGDSAFGSRAQSEQVMAWGDDAPGIEFKFIESKKRPPFLRGRRDNSQ